MKKIKKILFKIFCFLKDDNFALRIIYKTYVGKNCRLKNNNYGSEPFLISIGDHVSAINVDFITHDGAVWLWREENPNIDLYDWFCLSCCNKVGNEIEENEK